MLILPKWTKSTESSKSTRSTKIGKIAWFWQNGKLEIKCHFLNALHGIFAMTRCYKQRIKQARPPPIKIQLQKVSWGMTKNSSLKLIKPGKLRYQTILWPIGMAPLKLLKDIPHNIQAEGGKKGGQGRYVSRGRCPKKINQGSTHLWAKNLKLRAGRWVGSYTHQILTCTWREPSSL